ncbi:hypothetical protein GPALN_011589 [Globodera pallida]|nr:hypothetical protein GPALN_011589 [Globodera pallida]
MCFCRPNDYLEVGEDDQFSPRCHDAMPDNIYDTNIFNPRARQHLANTSAAAEGTAQNSAPNGAAAAVFSSEIVPEAFFSFSNEMACGIRTSAGNYQQINGGVGVNPYGRFQEFGNA